MTKKELIKALKDFNEDKVAIVEDEAGGWDNIINVIEEDGCIKIIFGGGSPFTSER